jgi:hypothetical protein
LTHYVTLGQPSEQELLEIVSHLIDFDALDDIGSKSIG